MHARYGLHPNHQLDLHSNPHQSIEPIGTDVD